MALFIIYKFLFGLTDLKVKPKCCFVSGLATSTAQLWRFSAAAGAARRLPAREWRRSSSPCGCSILLFLVTMIETED